MQSVRVYHNPTLLFGCLISLLFSSPPAFLPFSSSQLLLILGSRGETTQYSGVLCLGVSLTLSLLFSFFCSLLPLISVLPLQPRASTFLFPPSPSISSPAGDVGGKTNAVEIKVIKDLPWPPPVGQLNTSPPVLEELESPSQTTQPQAGQTSCDQHHHGGCWCSHCNGVTHTLLTSSCQSIRPSKKLLSVVCHIVPFVEAWYDW